MHGLAGAVDAALGEHIDIEACRSVAAGDASVSEIEGRGLEAQEGVVAGGERGDEECRRQSAFAAGKPRLEGDAAVGAGGLGGEHLVVACDQPELDA
jgi:hypothetical protein